LKRRQPTLNIDEIKETSDAILDTVQEYFVGNRLLLTKVLCSALANGHILFEDNPGLGKTLLAKVFARTTGCDWKRIQFTPDLMPSDITGTKVWRVNSGSFSLEKGPVFTNILLADEINRSPPKVQSALLECMDERQVTIEGDTQKLGRPFFVMATQNPIEFEGTYPLPEAQLDRFSLKLSTGYVETLYDAVMIMKRREAWKRDDPIDLIESATTTEVFASMQDAIEHSIYVDDQIYKYIAELVRATRASPYVEVGSSPRGALSLFKVARAHAAVHGRDYVIPDDVKTYTVDALSHRLIMKLEYTLEERITPEDVVRRVLEQVEAPKGIVKR